MGSPLITVTPMYLGIKQNLDGAFVRRAKLVVANLTPNVSTAWQASHTYTVGAQILDSNGNVQQCTTAGTSGSSAPTWNGTVGGTTTDGTAVWTNLGTNANTVAHGLPGSPRTVDLMPTSAGSFHQTKAPDATNIYITADGAGASVELHVEY